MNIFKIKGFDIFLFFIAGIDSIAYPALSNHLEI